ncbi:MAG: hypothetical protein IV100_08495 [Myxococcales bacterium]|nr:hypothetical protein [Myxococcales bacterium]
MTPFRLLSGHPLSATARGVASRGVTLRALSLCLVVGLSSSCSLEITPKSPSPSPVDATGDTGATDSTDVSLDVETTDDGPVVPSCQCGAPFCRTEGICRASQPTCVQNEDGTCQWDCGYPEGWVEAETDAHCDDEDNDCDGVTDDVPDRTSDAENCASGVCQGTGSRCEKGSWVCDMPSSSDYELVETKCDDKDNDCDGETDEGPTGGALTGSAAKDCGFLGQCLLLPSIACKNGLWDCNQAKTGAPLFESVESTCDGLDNDCDGDVDEALTNPADSDCKKVGVCATTAPAVGCVTGSWSCNYGAIPDYEVTESTCDGKDNDCDGLTDENLSGLLAKDCTGPSQAQSSEGVCKAGATVVCVGGITTCLYTSVPGFEAVETLCDGKDNDCDGDTDEGVVAPASFCQKPGVCSLGVTPSCDSNAGAFVCDYGIIGDFEVTETRCDGKDNDCDGQTDESLSPSPAACAGSGEGVCKDAAVKTSCVFGTTVCDFPNVGYEATETSCDNKDNDCDGLTDEGIGGSPEAVAASTCRRLGVCSDTTKVQATCSAGTWSCSYAQLGANFEATETICDGKDNDCDGYIDENIVGEGLPECSLGVCAAGTSALCVQGEFVCNAAGIVGYENPEASCDGKDNNCDGSIDELACLALSPCTSNAQCKSGRCRPTPDGEDSCCVSADDECPSNECKSLKKQGETACLSLDVGEGEEPFVTTCTLQGWDSDPDVDKCTTGACSDGVCRECSPGTRVCDGESSLLPCTDAGEYGEPISCPQDATSPTCLSGFPGACLRHLDQQLNTTGSQTGATGAHPFPIRTTDNLHVVVWSQDAPGGNPPTLASLIARASDAYGRPGATLQPLAQGTASLALSEPHGVRISATQSAVVWRESNTGSGDTGNIRIRGITNSTGAGVGSAATVSSKSFEQRAPRIARVPTGNFGVVWQTESDPAGNGKDIAIRLYTFNGSAWTPIAVDKLLNAGSTDGDQTEPAIVALDDGTFLVAYTDSTTDSPASLGVYARRYDPAAAGGGAPLGSPYPLHTSVAGDQKDVEIVARPGGFVAVWTTTHLGAGDLMARAFKNDGTPLSSEILLTKQLSGLPSVAAQGNADITVTSDGSVVVVYEDAEGDASGGSIQLLQLTPSLDAIDTARRVNENEIPGTQRRPRVAAAFDPFGTPWVLVTFEDVDQNGPGTTAGFVRPVILRRLP